jgi:O-6-methylguanine DNA methyltransferase
MKSTHFTQMNSPIGTISLCGTEHGLAGIFMENHCHGPSRAQLHGGTAFQRRVWKALEEVPFGVTISYGELARRINQPAAVRAVGLANGRNPLSIVVPCHRVIGSNGKLTGYGGGMERKRWLLDLESCAVQQAPVSPSMPEQMFFALRGATSSRLPA